MDNFQTMNNILKEYSIEELIPELNPQQKGDYYILKCPVCGKNEAYIYNNTKIIKCNRRDKCGYEKPLINYLEERENKNFFDLMITLAQNKNINLNLDIKKYNRKFIEYRILNEAQNILINNLWENKNNPVFKYLKEIRGYSEKFIAISKLGYLISLDDLKNKLVNKGFSRSSLDFLDYHFKHFEDTHKLVLTYKDQYGKIINFKRRAITNISPKYVNSKGFKDTLFNLENIHNSKIIYIVEGEFDALSLTYNKDLEKRTFKNIDEVYNFVYKSGVLATGGKASLSSQQAEYLKKYINPEKVILIPDNDKAGKKNIYTSIKNLQNVGIYNIEIISISSSKDVDELINNFGYNEFESYDSIPFLEWIINEEIENIKLKEGNLDYYTLFQKFNIIKEKYVQSEINEFIYKKYFERYFDKELAREIILRDKKEKLFSEMHKELNKLYQKFKQIISLKRYK
ncbi:toprim domain-containing protein [Marinitoga lauensis]|uniref:toprim domain-containing protein n=1 Tax=Marinitoga lauensis TaxID=2201189 RepID=UPI001011E5AD|nr:toprim domain-containing protein [Marinitoga lauensis]